MTNTKKNVKVEKVQKPFMRGSMIDRTFWRGALKFVLATLVMLIAYTMICVMMSWDNKVLSIVINSAIVLACLLVFHQTGAVAGADAVNQGEIMYAREEKGRPVEKWERELCYHPLKGLMIGLAGSIPLLICSVLLAVTAQRQMTTLGALPSWITPLETRAEIGNALAYYHDTGVMTLEAAMRLVIRMSTMPYVSMIGASNSDAMLLLERISPLLNLLPALAYGLGYTGGVSVRTAVHTNIALGKKKARRKQAKERKARRQTTRRGPEQLN